MTDIETAYKEAYKKAIAAYLKERIKTDTTLAEACKKENKSMDGLLKYVTDEARKQAKNNVACIPDEEVYGWAVHYLLEDSIDCEPKNKKSNSPDADEADETEEQAEENEATLENTPQHRKPRKARAGKRTYLQSGSARKAQRLKRKRRKRRLKKSRPCTNTCRWRCSNDDRRMDCMGKLPERQIRLRAFRRRLGKNPRMGGTLSDVPVFDCGFCRGRRHC